MTRPFWVSAAIGFLLLALGNSHASIPGALQDGVQETDESAQEQTQTPRAETSDNVLLSDDEKAITEIETLLTVQDECWNRGDIDGFMEPYWNSEELTFSGGGSITRGWQQTKDRYIARYHPPEKMGQLHFDGLETRLIGTEAALVLGNWHLVMNDGEKRDGNFSLVLQKIDDQWKIIHDHSSTLEKPTLEKQDDAAKNTDDGEVRPDKAETSVGNDG